LAIAGSGLAPNEAVLTGNATARDVPPGPKPAAITLKLASPGKVKRGKTIKVKVKKKAKRGKKLVVTVAPSLDGKTQKAIKRTIRIR